MGRKWRRHAVLKKLCERRDAGKSLCYLALSREEPALRYSLRKMRGGWAGALSEIGEDPAKWRPYRSYSPSDVIKNLKMHAASGTLIYEQIRRSQAGLVRCARKHFGSWIGALGAANVRPNKSTRQLVRRQWTAQAVRDAIARRKSLGLSISGGKVSRDDSGLYRAASLFFGGWKPALDPSADPIYEPRRRISKQDVIAAIQKRFAQGLCVSATRMEPQNLVVIGVLRFGCWSDALAAAGLDVESVRLHKRWSEERVVAAIQERARQKLPINSASVRRGQTADGRLYEASVHYFGSWDNGLRAAGVVPQTVRLRKRWSKENIIAEIRALQLEGKGLNWFQLRRDHEGLLQACGRHFGTWAKAVEASGVRVPRAYQSWTRSKIIFALRDCDRERIPFASLPASLERSANRLFGSWAAAVRAAFGDRAKALLSQAKPRGYLTAKTG